MLSLPQALGAQIAHQARIGLKAADLVKPVARGCRIGEKPGVAADLWQARRIGGNDRATQGHRLKDRQTESLCQRRKREAKRVRVPNFAVSVWLDLVRDGRPRVPHDTCTDLRRNSVRAAPL
jgi:hypothetical protein